jgi:hypothetical protein
VQQLQELTQLALMAQQQLLQDLQMPQAAEERVEVQQDQIMVGLEVRVAELLELMVRVEFL